MHQYLHLMKHVLEDGVVKNDRTGTGTRSIFGWQMRFDLSRGFPLLTTKKLHLRSIIYELLWFLRGDTNIRWLNDNGVSIWDDWADPRTGELGPVYGHQWRSWPTPDGGAIDQISNLIDQIKTNPDSRRLIVSAWNVAEVEHMALPPCHCLFQFYVVGGREPISVKSGGAEARQRTALTEIGSQARASSRGHVIEPKTPSPSPSLQGGESAHHSENGGTRRLSCQLYQRSADIFLGVPFNIASYALLTMMIARVCDLEPGEFILTFGDAHLYSNHIEQAQEQLSREPRDLPEMRINPKVKSIFDFQYEDFDLRKYHPHPHIKAPIAV